MPKVNGKKFAYTAAGKAAAQAEAAAKASKKSKPKRSNAPVRTRKSSQAKFG